MIRCHLYEVLRVAKFIETESTALVSKGWRERGMGSYYLMDMKFQFKPVINILKVDESDGCMTM